jgi:hypothetical protein
MGRKYRLPLVVSSIAAFSFLGHGIASAAQPQVQQTFEFCGLQARSTYDMLKDAIAGVPKDKEKGKRCINDVSCKKNADMVYGDLSTKGAETMYFEVHGFYSNCTQQVVDRYGTTTLSGVEATYKDCAQRSSARFVVLLAIQSKTPIAEVKAQLGTPYYPLIETLYGIANEGGLAKAAAMSADQMSACVDTAEHR